MTDARRPFAIALITMVLGLSPLSAAQYADVEVAVLSEPAGESAHGYAEIWVRIVNRSSEHTRTVRLTYPESSYTPRTNYLRAVIRTVVVEPGKTARVALAFPEKLDVAGSDLGVTIDGTRQDQAIPLSAGSRGMSSRGYGGYPGSGSLPEPLVLFSRSVDTRFPDWAKQAEMLWHPAGRPVSSQGISCVRADQPVAAWGANWLGYSRYDGVVVTAAELTSMPADVRAAIGQYVECGGSLFVLGASGTLPGPWKAEPDSIPTLTRYSPGFGQCLVTTETDLSRWGTGRRPTLMTNVLKLLKSWDDTLAPWQRELSPVEANRRFPVVDDLGVPVKGLLALMFLFVVVIGPLNLYILSRWKRRLWLFWTVPLVSFATCLTVFIYMAAAEGWQGEARVEGFTVLDENTRRASTIGWCGFYTPLLPGSGLHFSPDTEVTFQNGDDSGSYYRRRSGSALTLDWSSDQHLASGWLTPRVPAHFVIRKGEQRRERVTFSRGADGRPEAVNGLGADLIELWYADESGEMFHARDVPAGATVPLAPIARPGTTRTLRQLYSGGDWATLVESLRSDPHLLAPRTYLAIMDAAPFLDEGLPAGSGRRARSAVLGIIKEGGDGG